MRCLSCGRSPGMCPNHGHWWRSFSRSVEPPPTNDGLGCVSVLALIHNEPGHELVAETLPGAILGAANSAEVVGKLLDADIDVRRLRVLLSAAGVVVEQLTAGDAELAGALRALEGGRTLSLGDRCCLALTTRMEPAEVLTADRAWTDLDLPVQVRLTR